jgi:hypothetical protein
MPEDHTIYIYDEPQAPNDDTYTEETDTDMDDHGNALL